MSNGLLRGLAARALGLDTPLRSQRTRSFDGLSAEPAWADEPSPFEAAAKARSRKPSAAPQNAERASTDAHEAPHGASAADAGAATPTAGAGRRADEPAPGHHGIHPPAVPSDRNASRAPPRAAAATASAAAVAAPRRDAHGTQRPATVAAPSARTIRVEIPAPLLPLSAPARLPTAAAASGSTPMRRGPRTAAAETPTEVHVSIGRIELSAPAPTANTRTPARREAPAGRSLADYLRGAGGKRPA